MPLVSFNHGSHEYLMPLLSVIIPCFFFFNIRRGLSDIIFIKLKYVYIFFFSTMFHPRVPHILQHVTHSYGNIVVDNTDQLVF